VDIRDFLAICLNWDLTHRGTFGYEGVTAEFDIERHKPVLEIIYDEVKNANSGPRYAIKLYLEKLLGLTVSYHFILRQNYPNPFNNATSIEYHVAEKAHIRLTVFDLLGRQVKCLIDGISPGGVYKIVWNGMDDNGNEVASGIYFYSLKSSRTEISRKMILIK
jgi:hypothetical protein